MNFNPDKTEYPSVAPQGDDRAVGTEVPAMKISDFAAKFGCVRLTPEDNPKIQAFYNSMAMTSEKFSVHTKKEPDYFRFLAYAADNHHVFGYPNAQGELEGMVSLIVRPCYIGGRPDRVGHFLDLRFKRRKERTIKGDWKELGLGFTRFGSRVEEAEGCRIYHGSYITTNIYATASIGKDAHAKAGPKKTEKPVPERKAAPAPPEKATATPAPASEAFRVSNLATYQAINIYARKPWKILSLGSFGKSREKLMVTQGTEKDIEPLKAFLDRQNRPKTFGYIYAGPSGELERRLRRWDGLSMSSFFIARDLSGKILGAFGAFDPGRGRQLYIDALPPEKERLAKLGAMAGLKVPRPNENIDILYLTSLELDHDLTPDLRLSVFDRLLSALFRSGIPRRYHIVSFCDYNKQSLLEVVSGGYMYDATPVLLYQLHSPEATEVYRESDMVLPPGHEMVLM